MTAFCPNCGYDVRRTETVTDGPYSYHPRNGLTLDGERLKLRPAGHELLGSLMLARGGIVAGPILAERIGYEGDQSVNYIAVQISHARAILAAAGLRFPVETVFGCGYRWNIAAVPSRFVRRLPARAAA